MGALEDLGRDADARQGQIVSVLVDAFEDLIEADPRAFRRKFRKMAQDPFSFYRGSACLFYADVAEMEDRYADERTSRVWIQGDLHAENYGTYLNDAGILVFDVNDFDEAYLGHFTWDLKRMAASLALLGFAKAVSDGRMSMRVPLWLEELYTAVFGPPGRPHTDGCRAPRLSFSICSRNRRKPVRNRVLAVPTGMPSISVMAVSPPGVTVADSWYWATPSSTTSYMWILL